MTGTRNSAGPVYAYTAVATWSRTLVKTLVPRLGRRREPSFLERQLSRRRMRSEGGG